MHLPVQLFDGHKGLLHAITSLTFGNQPMTEMALLNILKQQGFTLALGVFFDGDYPGALLDAGKEQRHILVAKERQFSPNRIGSPSG
jgi:hypothetical protein